jgi:hypothetical protein
MFKFYGYAYFIITLLKFLCITEDFSFTFFAAITALIIMVYDYNTIEGEKRINLENDDGNYVIDKL